MIQARTRIEVADNSGAKKLGCIQVLGGSRKRYGTVGDIITVFKNLELHNLFFGLSLELCFDLAELTSLLKQKSAESVKNKAKAYLWLAKNFPNLLQKRAIVQKRRVVSDRWLQNKHFLVNTGEALREYMRLSALT